MMFIGDVWFPFVCFFFSILSATLLQCYYDQVYNPILEESAEEDATSHFPSEQVSMATDTMVFDVTFTKAELDLAIQSSEVGSELPIISGAPSTPLENQFSVDFHGTRLSPSVDRRPYLNDTEIAGSGVSMPQTGETRHFTFDKSSACLMFI